MNKEELKELDQLEIIVDETTYTLKKINAKRRAIILKKILGKLNITNTSSVSEIMKSYSACLESLSEVIWDFLTDEDKKSVGTKEKLDENLTDESGMSFFVWCIVKSQEINSFLAESPTK